MILRVIFFFVFMGSLYAEKEPLPHYQLYDVGAAGKIAQRLPPHLNNEGFVIANKEDGAVTWKKSGEEFCPKISDGTIHFHAVNSHGDVLVSLRKSDKSIAWAIWPQGGQCEEHKKVALQMNAYQKKSKKMCLNALSDDRIVAGCFLNHHGEPKILQTKDKNAEFRGIYQGMTASGILYGFSTKESEPSPAVWNSSAVAVGIKNYRSKVVPEGIIRPETLTMAPDGVVYGSYWVEYKDANPIVLGVPKVYYNFAWKPATGEYKQIDIDGMRVIKVNASHTLIGTLNGKPALCEGGKKPVELTKLLSPEQKKEWEVLTISDLNDSNQLVGIGKLHGELHLFFAERIEIK